MKIAPVVGVPVDPHTTRDVGGVVVHGVDVDPETRCAHYRTDRDVVAIRFRCCGTYYPCSECHATVTDHPPERWPADTFDTTAVLCGVCGTELTVRAYLHCGDTCPHCEAAFNPGCRRHRDRYFVVD
jgi:uncharacterized CHY-type Zn-finger protein